METSWAVWCCRKPSAARALKSFCTYCQSSSCVSWAFVGVLSGASSSVSEASWTASAEYVLPTLKRRGRMPVFSCLPRAARQARSTIQARRLSNVASTPSRRMKKAEEEGRGVGNGIATWQEDVKSQHVAAPLP
eukprot:3542317-Pyramimonas_sp.AAC.3